MFAKEKNNLRMLPIPHPTEDGCQEYVLRSMLQKIMATATKK